MLVLCFKVTVRMSSCVTDGGGEEGANASCGDGRTRNAYYLLSFHVCAVCFHFFCLQFVSQFSLFIHVVISYSALIIYVMYFSSYFLSICYIVGSI